MKLKGRDSPRVYFDSKKSYQGFFPNSSVVSDQHLEVVRNSQIQEDLEEDIDNTLRTRK